MCNFIRYDNRKNVNLIEKIFRFIRKLFFKISVEEAQNARIILIPYYQFKNKFLNQHANNIILRKLKKYINENNLSKLVFDNDFIKMNIENERKLSEKLLMKSLILDILKYIFQYRKEKMHLHNIYIFVNEYNKENLQIIEQLARNFKCVNIITENINKFKKLEQFLYNEGLVASISNNKRKSARNAKIIVNIDFNSSAFEKYTIGINPIIINLINEQLESKKILQGIIINNINVNFNNNYETWVKEIYGDVNKELFIETLCSGKNIKKSKELFDNISGKINGVIGIRGVISKSEFFS